MRKLWKELWKYSYTNVNSMQCNGRCAWLIWDCHKWYDVWSVKMQSLSWCIYALADVSCSICGEMCNLRKLHTRIAISISYDECVRYRASMVVRMLKHNDTMLVHSLMNVNVYVHSLCICNKRDLQLQQHNCVRPVLKHGPRSLVYVQVSSRDCPMHNKCKNALYMGVCRQQINKMFEH